MEETKKRSRIEISAHMVSAGILLASLLISVLSFGDVFDRTWQAVTDLARSALMYVARMLALGDIVTPTVNMIPDSTIAVLPFTPEEFKSKLSIFWELLFSKANLRGFTIRTVRIITVAVSVGLSSIILLLLIFAMPKIISKQYTPDKHGKSTVFLRAAQRMERLLWVPMKRYIRKYIEFLGEHKKYVGFFIAIWTFNLNLWTIAIEAIAYLVYLSVSFDIGNIFTQGAKLAMDLTVMVDFFPFWAWIVIGIVTFEVLRRWLGWKKLDRLQKENEKNLEENAGALFLVGPPRAGKTMLLTAFLRLIERMFRKRALKGMLKREKQFPYFPWVNVDEYYHKAREEEGKMYIVAQYHELIKRLRLHYKYRHRYEGEKGQFMKDFLRWRYKELYGYDFEDFIFGYDTKLYDVKYNNGVEMVDAFQAVEGYISQLHIYATQSSLVFGNYSTRSEVAWKKKKVFPKYDPDFWKKHPRKIEAVLDYCHIADQDMLRVNKLVAEGNPNKDALEFGVWGQTEYAKERGNQLTNKGKSVNDEDANTLNDGMERNIKTISHGATIDNYNFFRWIADDQRAMSLGAENRDLCKVLLIKARKEDRCAIPFYGIEKFLNWFASKCYDKTHLEEKYHRSDYTLTMYIMRKIFTPIFHHVERTMNTFGYDEMRINASDAVDDTKLKWSRCFALHKDVYGAYATDTFKGFYWKKALRSKVGIDSLPRYKARRMTPEEMRLNRSYYFNDITKTFFGDAAA